MDLFSAALEDMDYKPLAERMRPRSLKNFVGQGEIISGYLQKAIESERLPSMIIYGPPGTGKTTLAQIIANTTKSNFQKLNATMATIADIRRIIKEAEDQLKFYQRRTILFIDEVHRFNKVQQDVLLPYVEDGRIILIGATTENPFYEVNQALVSRVKIIKLEPLTAEDIKIILRRAIALKKLKVSAEAINIISDYANGDARAALNVLEQAASYWDFFDDNNSDVITADKLKNIIGGKILKYDKDGSAHYDTISAFIKSMRSGDEGAAISYLAQMILGGEDINFISRRMVIFAAEDVGNADPQALILANAAAQAAQFVGLPEARIILSQAAIYLAKAPKDRDAYTAIEDAMQDITHVNKYL